MSPHFAKAQCSHGICPPSPMTVVTLPFKESGPEGPQLKNQLVTQRKYHGTANCCRGMFESRHACCVGCPDDRLVRAVSCTGPQAGLVIPFKKILRGDRTNVEMKTPQFLRGPVMCESCAALIVLQGFSETDPKKRQPAYAVFDYDLRDQTDNAEPWIAPVQPLTNLQ